MQGEHEQKGKKQKKRGVFVSFNCGNTNLGGGSSANDIFYSYQWEGWW